MCLALRGSTVSYAGDAHFPKHSLEYSLNFWSQSKKKEASMAEHAERGGWRCGARTLGSTGPDTCLRTPGREMGRHTRCMEDRGTTRRCS